MDAGPHEWEVASRELREVIGDVTLALTELDESLGELILDLFVLPPHFGFFRQFVLAPMMIGRKLELLTNYAKTMPDLVADAEAALSLLGQIADANRRRNRLVHDLHDVDLADGRVTSRRLWQEEAQTVPLIDYLELSERLYSLSGQIDVLSDALTLPNL